MGYTVYEIQHPVVKEKGQLVVTSPFGSRVDPISGKAGTWHAGIDSTLWTGKAGISGTIVAFADGKVTSVYDDETGEGGYKKSSGNYVIIDHGNGYTTRYYHLAKGVKNYTKVGAVVKKGTPIGYMGMTGYATGTHLHFEVRINGKEVDPLPYLLGQKKFEEQKGDDTMEFKVGDVVSIVGNTYYTGKTVPAWVKAKKWIVSDVKDMFVIVDKSEDGSNAIKSPFRGTDLKLEHREEKKENPLLKEIQDAYKVCGEILQDVGKIELELENLRDKLEKMLEA